MWLKKWAESTENAASYQKAIDIIKQKSGLNDTEIRDYYAGAIEKEILKYGKQRLGKFYSKAELKSFLQPLINYYINPTDANLQIAANARKQCKSPSYYSLVVMEISPDTSFSSKFSDLILQSN